MDFEANAKDGIAIDWPIRHKDLAPWYDHVERFIGVSGTKQGLPQLPDGQFQPGMELNVVEKDIAQKINTHYKKQRHLFIGRIANLTSSCRVGVNVSIETGVGKVAHMVVISVLNRALYRQHWLPATFIS